MAIGDAVFQIRKAAIAHTQCAHSVASANIETPLAQFHLLFM